MFSTGLDMETGSGQSSQGASVTVDTPYVYQETRMEIMGPVLPDIGGLGEAGYLQHIRSSVKMMMTMTSSLIICVSSGPHQRQRELEAMWRVWDATGRCKRQWLASILCRASPETSM